MARTFCYTGTSRPWLCLILPRCAVLQRLRHKACTFTAPPQPCKLSNRWDCWRAIYPGGTEWRLGGRCSGSTGRHEAGEGSCACFIAEWQDSLEGAHDAKGKVQPSLMTSLHSPTPISTASSFLTLKRRKEEDPSLVLLMKHNSPSSSCPALWMKREDEPTTSPPLGLLGRVRRHCWHGFHRLT